MIIMSFYFSNFLNFSGVLKGAILRIGDLSSNQDEIHRGIGLLVKNIQKSGIPIKKSWHDEIVQKTWKKCEKTRFLASILASIFVYWLDSIWVDSGSIQRVASQLIWGQLGIKLVQCGSCVIFQKYCIERLLYARNIFYAQAWCPV